MPPITLFIRYIMIQISVTSSFMFLGFMRAYHRDSLKKMAIPMALSIVGAILVCLGDNYRLEREVSNIVDKRMILILEKAISDKKNRKLASKNTNDDELWAK